MPQLLSYDQLTTPNFHHQVHYWFKLHHFKKRWPVCFLCLTTNLHIRLVLLWQNIYTKLSEIKMDFEGNYITLTILSGKTVLLNSVQEFIEIQAWLLLLAFPTMFTQLISILSNFIYKRKPTLSRHIKLNHTYIALNCRKQDKNIENSQIIEQNAVISLCPSLCLLWLALPSPSSVEEFFPFFDTVLRKFQTPQVIIRAVYSFVFWFENDFLQVKPS